VASQLIGVDVGGTAIKLARYDSQGTLLAQAELATPRPAVPGAVTMALVEAVRQLDPQGLAPLVGVGLPGPMDAAARISRVAINLVGWENVPLAEWLEPQLDRRVTLANDANCALMGEAWHGAARGHRDVVLLTLGTGVGGAVLLNGALFTGRGGAAGELGLIGLDPDGPPCNSGNRGSLEQHCSIAGLARLDPRDPRELSRLAAAGDPGAQAVWQAYGRLLGIGLSSLLYVLTPELVLLGGGLSAAAEHFLPALWAEVAERVRPENREDLVIRRCALGNGAGSLGAAWLARERLGQEPRGQEPLGMMEP
jgi:glucokinase